MTFETVKLSDVADIIVGFAFKSQDFNTNANGIRLVRGKNITKRSLRWGDDTRWWNDFSLDLEKYYLRENDIVISMDGSLVGKNYAKINKTDLPLLLVQRVACIRAKKGVSQEYLWQIISTSTFENYIDAVKTGTTIPHISGKQIGEYEIPFYDYDTQKRISCILSAIEDRIVLNTAINENLQQQAQAIYRSMFSSTHHELDKIGLLSELITVKYGKDHKKLNDGIYPVYGSGGIMRYVEKPLYDKESVLIPRKGSLNNVMYVDEPFWSVDTMFYTEMKLPNIAKFVFHFVKSKDLSSLNAGSAVPSMTTDILNSMKITIPSIERLACFEGLVAPLYRTIKSNIRQSERLSALRDTLLPKLMNGEIDVPDVSI